MKASAPSTGTGRSAAIPAARAARPSSRTQRLEQREAMEAEVHLEPRGPVVHQRPRDDLRADEHGEEEDAGTARDDGQHHDDEEREAPERQPDRVHRPRARAPGPARSPTAGRSTAASPGSTSTPAMVTHRITVPQSAKSVPSRRVTIEVPMTTASRLMPRARYWTTAVRVAPRRSSTGPEPEPAPATAAAATVASSDEGRQPLLLVDVRGDLLFGHGPGARAAGHGDVPLEGSGDGPLPVPTTHPAQLSPARAESSVRTLVS